MTDQPPLVIGRITSAPAGGTVDVVIPSFDGGEQKFDGCPFLPGAIDPAIDDECVVGFIGPHTTWVLSWRTA
jgi:hypothetical protein